MTNSKESFLKRSSKNHEGYPDPTPHEAIKNIDAEARRVDWIIKTINSVCELAGFHIEGRVVLRDIRTGKVWR